MHSVENKMHTVKNKIILQKKVYGLDGWMM